MQVDNQCELFADPTFRHALTGFQEEMVVSDIVFVHNLLQLPEREKRIQQFLDCLMQKQGCHDKYNQLKWLFKKLLIVSSAQGIALPDVSRVQALFQTPALASPMPATLGKFPLGNIPLSRFSEMAKDRDFLDALEEEVSSHTFVDPEMVRLFRARSRHPDAPLRYSDLCCGVEDQPELVLIPAPTLATIERFFEMVIQKRAKTLITLCSTYESERIVPYWESSVMQKVKLPPGWTITLQKYESIFQSQKLVRISETQQAYPQVIACTYEACSENDSFQFIHLHYANWPDGEAVPDRAGLFALHDYKDAFCAKAKGPTVINCRYGIGRTAISALVDVARNRVQNELKNGKKANEIVLNLPELLYQLRRTLPHIGGNDFAFGLVYDHLARFYQLLTLQQ